MTSTHLNYIAMQRTSGPRVAALEGDVRLGIAMFRGYATRGRAP